MNRVPTVLVVEDDPYISELIAIMLEEANYNVRTVSTGAAALAQVDVGSLDLVILDWMLPDSQGDELCRAIKAGSGNAFLPVLMLTARGELADRIAGFEAGADDYLTKPFHGDELLARVRALLRIRAAEIDRIEALNALARQHSELKAAYDQLRATQTQLVHTSRLAALGELVAGVAHELNNPLAIILGNAELLPDSLSEDDRRAVAQIIAGAQRARRVIQSLVAFARQGNLEPSWYSPRDLIERVLDLKGASLRTAGIALSIEYAPDLPMLRVDGAQIQQVLLNLLLNAEQVLVGRPEPRITIRVFVSPAHNGLPPSLPGAEQAPSLVDGKQVVIIDVADNGPGLNPVIADRIFQPFVTTRPVGQGTGMGLAIAYGIVVQHGGSLQVASEPNQGATFRIALPVERETPASEPASNPVLPAPTAGLVIVIDDEPDILDLIKRFLSRKGYTVTGVESAQVALQLLQSHPCDIILCDVRMPDMDGIAFYDQLQVAKLERQPRLIIMTGDTSNARTDAFLRQSKLPVLRKPFSGDELLELITTPEQ